MKYVQINSVPNGSTGAIMLKIHNERLLSDDESWVLWGRGRDGENEHECNFGSKLEFYFDVLLTRAFGKAGFHSKRATRRLLARLDEINPDIVHLHNIHGYYINVEMLFDWLRARKQKTIWTLHDCWAFTGHCAYFTQTGCSQWKVRCGEAFPCPQLKDYPKTYSKSSCADSFQRKKAVFTSLSSEDLTIVTPSQWLAGLVADSFLAKYETIVKHNEIDLEIFKPTIGLFREDYGLKDSFIILGVASPWSERKGLPDFVKLRSLLDKTYSIVLVGLSEGQIASLPEGIIGIKRTESKEALACIYSTADVFFNPTYEDNFPTVNLEAQACGTPVLTYDVGGCKETLRLSDSKCVTFEEVPKMLADMRNRKERH